MKVETCPHGKITVTREYIWNEFKKSFLTSKVEIRDAKDLARECVNYGVDIMICVEIYSCGCLLNIVYDGIEKGAYIIPYNRALEWLKDEVEHRKRFEYLYKKYQRLFSLRNFPTT